MPRQQRKASPSEKPKTTPRATKRRSPRAPSGVTPAIQPEPEDIDPADEYGDEDDTEDFEDLEDDPASELAITQGIPPGAISPDGIDDVFRQQAALSIMEEPIAANIRLTADMLENARSLGYKQARWLVDTYYQLQDGRIAANHRMLMQKQSAEPGSLLHWVTKIWQRFEWSLKTALGEFASVYKVGQWLQAQFGIGPVLSAALITYPDIRKAPTVGHIYRFGGLDPTLIWLGKRKSHELLARLGITPDTEVLTMEQITAIHDASGQHVTSVQRIWADGYKPLKGAVKRRHAALQAWLSARPWNMKLKSIFLFRLGETLVRFCNRPACFYGRLYSLKQVELAGLNASGAFAARAAGELAHARSDAKLWNKMKSKDRVRHWTAGHLCPAHIHDMARRWMVKMVVSHLHEMMYRDFYNGDEPPAPYIIEHPGTSDHRHIIVPPLRDQVFDGRSLRELYGTS